MLIRAAMGGLRVAVGVLSLVAAATAAALEPVQTGYAFESPRVLAQQMIFGRAHAVTLLMRSCAAAPGPVAIAARDAYDEWLQRYAASLRRAEQDLARHYFGVDRDAAGAADIATALGLAPTLDGSMPQSVLADACATLPAALTTKRHNLDLIYALHADETRLVVGVEVDARVAACLAGDATAHGALRESVVAAAEVWKQQYAGMIEAASARRRHFRGESAAEWVRWQTMIAAQARRRFSGSAAECAALPEFLTSAAASPVAAFQEDSEHVGSNESGKFR